MSGYRDNSGFDPSARARQSGAPLRPFNALQWLGVAFMAAGALALVAYVLGRLGVVPGKVDDVLPGIMLLFCGSMLVHSRRQGGALTPATKRQRIIILAAALAICVLVAALVIYFKGA
jgi:hypothetical protein